jgi:phosphoribosylformylglycinamidine (FGAM) synthase-like enzyme
LFNEAQSRILISCAPGDAEKIVAMLTSKKVPYQQIGVVAEKTLRIQLGGEAFSWEIEAIHDDWFNAIRRAVESEAEPVRSL